MFASFIASVVDFCRKYAGFVVLAAFVTSGALAVYVANNISVNTDINQLLAPDLEWRQREKALEAAFPHKVDTIVAVVDGSDPTTVERAAEALAKKLSAMPEQFTFVNRPDALPFFRANGLLFLSPDELGNALDQIAQAQAMMGAIISDPSLRGFFGTIGMMMQGVQAGAVESAQIEKPLDEIAAALRAAASGQERFLNWRSMMPESNDPFAARELRKYVIVKPVLDYTLLQPGEAATKAIKDAVNELGVKGVQVRLTGSVPLNDDEFASVSEGAEVSTALSAVLVFGLLFMALGTWRIVAPIALTLVTGLLASTAFATFAVGSLNLISVAFAVMFIGMAVDFGIQFGVRYRDVRSHEPDHALALRKTGLAIAAPLALATAVTAMGFFAFTPTDYRGVSELGLIAGASMIIAFVLNVTLLPALMTFFKPAARAEEVGYAGLALVDAFLTRNRKPLLAVFAFFAIGSLALASQLRFDFDPLNLKNPEMESVSTMFEVMQDPDSDAYAAQVLAESDEEAQKLADKLSGLSEVDHVMTLKSFIPEEQDKKLAMIADTAELLAPTFAMTPQPAPSVEENIAALRKASEVLHQAGGEMPAAQRLADAVDLVLANPTPEVLLRAEKAIIAPLQTKFAEMRKLLDAKTVTLEDIPAELKRDWVTHDGRHLVEVFPKREADNDPRDPKMLNRFIDAVQKAAPEVTGTPVSIRESGRTIISAFIQAGLYAFVSITLLALVVLRNARDVGFMLVPLLFAGLLTLGTMAALGLPLNFANIIALPLLYSLGVSYAIYFVSLARQGHREFLSSSTARAVLFSAATTLVAFISLSFSSHTGTRGMGELLTISLLYSLSCTLLVLPVLYAFRKKDTV
jgi:hopanoid biosynthesis associated RND transporter like protein HpnN